MKKICLVIPSLQSGGMERVMSEIAGNFSLKRDVEVHLIVYGKNREMFFSIPDTVNLHTPKFQFNNEKRFYSTLKTLFFLRRTIDELNPDIILSLGEYWNSFVMMSLVGLNYPVYLSDRCKPDKNLGKWHELLRSWLYPRASGLIAQTEIAKEIFARKKLNKNIEVIGNPIKKVKSGDEGVSKENIILNVGRLIKSKHQDQLISIFNRLKRDDWKLVIVGGDALKESGMSRLKGVIEKYNLQDRVELTGNVENVEDYYLKSKIFAFTSSSEGFPNVIGEAMSSGLPVIAYDCIAGPADLIDDGETGFLVPLFDENSFQEKLKELIEKEELRRIMGIKGQKKARNFLSENISDKIYDFIKKI
jgi:GalNAc-alpha-(1->4)-GalNAc-alpha-(1->3)-diNAcBac-PP-undecaprenol alpha-1,4-N-acetyl-D-galactosaminyltransferase